MLPPIDIILVNYHCHADTLAAVARLGTWRHGAIRVVDNSVDAAQADILRRGLADRPDVVLTVAAENLGFGRGCNLAFGQSDTPLVLLLNPDARVAAEAVLELARRMLSEPVWGAVSPRIYWDPAKRFLLPPAFPQTPAVMLGTTLGLRWPRTARRVARIYQHHARRMLAGPALRATSCLAGAVMLVRRSAVQAAGGLFDPAYFMFYEDTDLSLRLRRAGFRLGIAPGVSAIHEYRHKAFKDGLMAESRPHYFSSHFPHFFRATRGLAWLDRLCRAAPVAALWGSAPIVRPTSAADFNRQFAGLGVAAFSPSPLMMPALLCAEASQPTTFSEDDWQRLEPGRYMALLAPLDGRAEGVHRAFER